MGIIYLKYICDFCSISLLNPINTTGTVSVFFFNSLWNMPSNLFTDLVLYLVHTHQLGFLTCSYSPTWFSILCSDSPTWLSTCSYPPTWFPTLLILTDLALNLAHTHQLGSLPCSYSATWLSTCSYPLTWFPTLLILTDLALNLLIPTNLVPYLAHTHRLGSQPCSNPPTWFPTLLIFTDLALNLAHTHQLGSLPCSYSPTWLSTLLILLPVSVTFLSKILDSKHPGHDIQKRCPVTFIEPSIQERVHTRGTHSEPSQHYVCELKESKIKIKYINIK